MCIFDDPYHHQRRAFDLAWRLIKHGARTGTISRWTGIAERRIRRLHRRYGRKVVGVTVRRPRGRSPKLIEYLLASPFRRQEASVFAQICFKMEVLPHRTLPDADRLLPGVERWELLCQAFEAFKREQPKSRITIEQGILIVLSLARCDEIELSRCGKCADVLIVDRLSLKNQWCVSCCPPRASLLVPARDGVAKTS
jgi:Flagellar transcriptional activator (FlhC)